MFCLSCGGHSHSLYIIMQSDKIHLNNCKKGSPQRSVQYREHVANPQKASGKADADKL